MRNDLAARLRAPWVWVYALALLSAGCVPFLASEPLWTTSFEGQVTRAGGTPVAGARVEVWGVESPADSAPAAPPFFALATDASGRYRREGRSARESAPLAPAFVVRVTPPAASGRRARSLGARAADVRFEKGETGSGDNVVRRRLDVVLEPAAP